MSREFLDYLTVRLLRSALTIVGVLTLVFLTLRLIPGDPVVMMVGEDASAEERAVVRRSLCLHRPLHEQYFLCFMPRVLSGSLGESYRHHTEVTTLIGHAARDTANLALFASALGWTFALTLGANAALERRSRKDVVMRLVSFLGVALPTIWVGPMLIWLFAVELRIAPMPGDSTGELRGLILPAITLGLALAAVLFRQTRSAMIETLGERFILAAHARGLPKWRIVFRHAMRNVLLPVMTIGAAQFAALLSGAVVTEKTFERPGLGTLMIDAFGARDLPVVQGCALVVACTYVLINLGLDLSYAWLDPRVRMASA